MRCPKGSGDAPRGGNHLRERGGIIIDPAVFAVGERHNLVDLFRGEGWSFQPERHDSLLL
ncbi:hypothetical protein E05_07260 [Plautia stali symbiont]|nr:hypothetical protein E05_07260 [Plautia stali symbiont]